MSLQATRLNSLRLRLLAKRNDAVYDFQDHLSIQMLHSDAIDILEKTVASIISIDAQIKFIAELENHNDGDFSTEKVPAE